MFYTESSLSMMAQINGKFMVPRTRVSKNHWTPENLNAIVSIRKDDRHLCLGVFVTERDVLTVTVCIFLLEYPKYSRSVKIAISNSEFAETVGINTTYPVPDCETFSIVRVSISMKNLKVPQ